MSSTVEAIAPFRGSRARRFIKIAVWLVAIALVVAALNLLGVNVIGWLRRFWDALSTISFASIVAAYSVETLETSLSALAWFFILRAAYPRAEMQYRAILAAYAVGVAMNGFLPASTGTIVTLLMFAALIQGATFPGVLAGMVVQKVFFTILSVFVYVYLFLTVKRSASIELGGAASHWGLTVLSASGAIVLVVLLCRVFWRKLAALWQRAKAGGAILAQPRDYLLRVVLPSLGAWLAKLTVIGIFLSAYAIPVTFHTLMAIIGGNSLAGIVAVTPGGAGVNQAINTASLRNVTGHSSAAAYSVGQQLTLTVWSVTLAIALVIWAFGWSGGKALVRDSYEDAKVKVAEQREERAKKKDAKRKLRKRKERAGR